MAGSDDDATAPQSPSPVPIEDGATSAAMTTPGTGIVPAGGGETGATGDTDDKKTSKWPDPFFWPVMLGFVPALIAALEVDKSTPSYALGSEWLYRFEVGLAVFVVCYVVSLIVCLAWQGRSFGRFELPGGGGAEPANPAVKIDEATEEVDDFQAETRLRFQVADRSFASLDSRLESLENDQARQRALQEAEERYEALQRRIEAVERER
jgi:hypothetical protein